MPIAAALATFRGSTSTYKGYINKAFTLDANGGYYLTKSEQAFVVESAFLRMFIAWETLLESAFIQYLLGAASGKGRIAQRHAVPQNGTHAHELLLGTQKYVDWANPEIVRTLAKLYFANGEPIGQVVASIQSDLFDLKTVRNAAAHLTNTTGHRLDAVASRRLSRTTSGISVTDFLLSLDPNVTTATTILDGYLGQLDVAAENIANWI